MVNTTSRVCQKDNRPDQSLQVDLQKKIAKIRTDLDHFSKTEIEFLARHGCSIASTRLEGSDVFSRHASPPQVQKTDPDAERLSDGLVESQRILQLSMELDKSPNRRIGLWNIRDWVSFALAAWVIVLLVLANIPFIYQTYRLQKIKNGSNYRCDQLAAEMQNDIGIAGVEFDKIDWPIAIPTCENALSIDPENPRLMDQLGRSLERAGRYADAAAWYYKATLKGYSWAENNLGVLYIEGRTSLDGRQDVPMDFIRGVSLLRGAASRNNRQAIINYAEQDFRVIFNDSPERVKLVEQSLIGRGFLQSAHASDTWTPNLDAALDAFKRSQRLDDEKVTLQVLDRLDVIAPLSRTITKQR